MQTTLATLRDIEGVLGSFLVDEAGQLMARDMPGIFDDATLNSASLRLSRLRGALESDTPSFNGCVARFGDHLLVVRPVAKRLLCVLVPRGANLTALQMGTNLVSRRIANSLPPTAEAAPATESYLPPMPMPAPAPSAPLPTPTATLPRAALPSLEATMSAVPPPPPAAAMPAPMEPIKSGLTPMASLSGSPPPVPGLPPPAPGISIVPNATIALLAQTKLAPSDAPSEPQRDSAPLVDPHPTRPLPKRFFRGRPVP